MLDSLFMNALIYTIIYSFIPQVFTEHSLSARLVSSEEEHMTNQRACPDSLLARVEDTDQ